MRTITRPDILSAVGKTPLFELKSFCDSKRDIRIFAKVEFLNASGSVKDRAAKAMILDGIECGAFTKEKILIDSTSGNTGIAYASVCAALGYRARLYMPANVTEERRKYMKALGAQIILTDIMEGIDGAYSAVQREVEAQPDRYFFPDQYTNKNNWLAHYNGTANEIIEQTDGRITHFVAGTGTSGTFMGCTRRLKETDPRIKCYNMTPDSPFHGIEGVKHCTCLTRHGFFDESVSDGRIEVTTEEAYAVARALAVKEGIFAGISSGANVTAAAKLALEAPEGSVIVTVLCDSGSRYFSGQLWRDADAENK